MDTLPITLSNKRFYGLSGSAAKIIALTAMTVDHIAVGFVEPGSETWTVMRSIGRVAFPIFALLVAEGFANSHNRLRYFVAIIAGAFLAEWPWQRLFGEGHNVMFTLAFAIMALSVFDRLHESKTLSLGGIALLAIFAEVVGCDYGFVGVVIPVVFYILRFRTIWPWIDSHYRSAYPTQTILQIMFVFPLMGNVIGAMLSSCAIVAYDGRRGFIKGRVMKYAAYIYYPLHLAVIAIITA